MAEDTDHVCLLPKRNEENKERVAQMNCGFKVML